MAGLGGHDTRKKTDYEKKLRGTFRKDQSTGDFLEKRPRRPGGKRGPQPPDHLSAAMKDKWRQTVRLYDWSEGCPLDLNALQSALEALDMAERAREITEREGLVIPGKDGNPVQHPACRIELQAKSLFKQLWVALGME